MEDDIDWVREMLIKGSFSQNNNLSTIIKIDKNDLTNINNSAGSSLNKLMIVFNNEDGEEITKSIVWKSKRAETGLEDVTEILQAFPIEIKLYSEVLASINKLLDLKGIKKSWPEFYGAKGNNILLEDLSSSGFTMKLDRKMDLDHAKISIKELGKYHAMSMIVIEKEKIDPSWFQPSIYARHIPFIMDLNKSAFNGLINSMRLHWGKEWEATANLIKKFSENIGDTLHELWYTTRHRYDVINHGEYWLNNLIYKYDDEGNVTDMRILDWQVSHYNSPCWDLALFLFGSMNPVMRQKHMNQLLNIYHEEFLSILNKFHFKGRIPYIAYFEETLEQMWIFCFLASITAPPWMLSSSKEGKYFTDDYSDKEILPSTHMPCYQWSSVREQMKKEVVYWMERGKL